MESFALWLWNKLISLVTAVLDWFLSILQALVDWLGASVVFILGFMLHGVTLLLSLVPVPSWWSSTAQVLSSISGTLGYFLAPFEFNFGAMVIVSAWGTRFLVRRLPFIG